MTSVEFSERIRQRTLGEDPPMADYPAAPVFPPHGGCSCGVLSHRGQGDSRHPEPDTVPWPDTYGVTEGDQINREILEIVRVPVPIPETSGRGTIQHSRSRFRCHLCYPSYLAARWHRLPWTFTVSLSAPAGCFEDWWNQADIYGALSRLVPPSRSVAEMLAEPFWVRAFATQPRHAWKRVGRDRRLAFDPQGGEPHAHLVVGNMNRVQVDLILARWPERGKYGVVKPVTNAFGAIHYALSQSRIARMTGESKARYLNRVKTDHMRGHDALLDAPQFSLTLDVQETVMAVRKTIRTLRPRTPEATALGERLAAVRWPTTMEMDGVILRIPLVLDRDRRSVVKLAVLLDTLAKYGQTRASG